MPRYVAQGSGQPIVTRNEITDWSTGNHGSKPVYKEGGSRTSITHHHAPPRGETPPRQEMRAASAAANGQYPKGGAKRDQISRSGKQTGPKLTPAVPRQITASRNDSFNRYSGVHESYGRRDRGKIDK